ncbi:hypothetical protein AHS81_24705 [Salmonella enterica]|nr:hypothetical protein [Salmonella enterica]
MDEKEVNFSLSYEQLLQETEELIKKYDLNKTGEHYAHNYIMARDILSFWHRLVLKGKTGPADASIYERIEADWERLDALIRNGSGTV